MDLKIKDVADLLHVSMTTIRRWLAEGKIPAYRLNSQYRFSRTEIEDWMLQHRLGNEKGVYLPFGHQVGEKEAEEQRQENPARDGKKGIHQFSLYRAIHKGGIYTDVLGETKEEIIRATTQQIAERFDLDADVLTDLLLDRERMMPTALSNGIGVPHTRDFLLNTHFDVITVVFPKNPIEYGALDGEPVHTLFFLFSCEDKNHLNLLAKIAHLSSNPQAIELFTSRPDKGVLLNYIKEWESTLKI